MSLELARSVADAVLYEGYLLYPYRASAQKNKLRWQWGVLVPREQSDDAGEPWCAHTDVLVADGEGATLRVTARFLQLETRAGEAPWDEGVEHEITLEVPLDGPDHVEAFTLPSAAAEARSREEVLGRLAFCRDLGTAEVPGSRQKLRVRLENVTLWHEPRATRDEVVRRSLVGAHLLLSLDRGSFVSLRDPPEWAEADAAACEHAGLWPVLVGDGDDVMLASPIIVEERPTIANASPGALYDSLEIDEILSLRTLTLTDEEKAEARATDPRAAAIIDRVDAMTPEMLERLHGGIREPDAPWWDPAADASVSPDTDTITIGGIAVRKGSKVTLAPREGGDAQDMFLVGRVATVEAVLSDVDGGHHLAVTIDDDPGADLLRTEGRFRYFRPDEVTPA